MIVQIKSLAKLIPRSSNFTSRADFSPSVRKVRSICFERSFAVLSSLLNAQPMRNETKEPQLRSKSK